MTLIKSIQDVDVRGKRVLLRVDYNVPLANGDVADDYRIRATLPTVRWLVEHGAITAACSHLGRPGGKVVEELRMTPVARRLAVLLGVPVRRIPTSIGFDVQRTVDGLRSGELILLENIRFNAGEDENNLDFARELSLPFDLLVNDAFGVAHRTAASVAGVTRYLPAYAGFLMAREVEVLSRVRDQPARPYVVLVGGKKVKDKLGTLVDLVQRVDGFVIGGGVAFTFLKALGYSVGDSIVDDSQLDTVSQLIRRATETGISIQLPSDVIAATRASDAAATRAVNVSDIETGWMGLDIGPRTIDQFSSIVAGAGTVVWTGPMGAFEFIRFSHGTEEMAKALSRSPAFTVVGGGETAEAIMRLGLSDSFGHVSTGGSASLSFLRGKAMPALDYLTSS